MISIKLAPKVHIPSSLNYDSLIQSWMAYNHHKIPIYNQP